MSDWSRKAAQQVQINRDTKLVENKKALQDEDICKRRAPELWKKLSEMFQRKCGEFNSEEGMSNTLYFSVENSNHFEVSAGRIGNTFKGDYDSTNHRFNFHSSIRKPYHSKIEVRVPDGHSDVSLLEDGRVSIDLESFVNAHLESLLGIA